MSVVIPVTKSFFFDEGHLVLDFRGRLSLVLVTQSPPGSLDAHLRFYKLEALGAQDVEVDFADHIGHG